MGTSIKVAATTFAASTSTGDQSITISGFGFTPKAAVIWAQPRSTTGLGPAAFYRHSQGFTDGTRTRCMGFRNEFNVTTTQTYRSIFDNGTIVHLINESAATTLAQASFSAFISDGITINWSTAAALTFQCGLILFGGDDLAAYCGDVAMSSATTDVTAPGFEPDLILTHSIMIAPSNNGIFTQVRCSFGGLANDGADPPPQRAVGYMLLNGNPNQLGGQYVSSDDVLADLTHTALSSTAQINTLDASGFTVERTTGSATTISYLAVNLSDFSANLVEAAMPSSTGSQAVTGFGFQPTQVIVLGSAEATLDTYSNSGAGGDIVTHTFGYFDASSQWVANGCGEVGAATTINAKSNLNVTDAVQIISNTGGSLGRASLTSFDSDGFTLNWNAASALVPKIFYLGLEGPSPAEGGTGIPVQAAFG